MDAPLADQRAVPDRVEAVLDWAGEPLSTQEIAAVWEIDRPWPASCSPASLINVPSVRTASGPGLKP
jgi:hypothetical protein